MKRYKPFLLGLLVGAALSFVALRYHIVRHAEGVSLVPRCPQPPVRSIYTDIRDWGGSMWEKHPEVAEALVADGRIDLISQGSLAEMHQGVQSAIQRSTERLSNWLGSVESHTFPQVHLGLPQSIEQLPMDAQEAQFQGVTIGPYAPFAARPPRSSGEVPVVDEAVAPASSGTTRDAFDPRGPLRSAPQDTPAGTGAAPARSGATSPLDHMPSVGVDHPMSSGGDAVAAAMDDLRMTVQEESALRTGLASLGAVSRQGRATSPQIQSDSSEFPSLNDLELGRAEEWLPGVLSSLVAGDGQTLHGRAVPISLDRFSLGEHPMLTTGREPSGDETEIGRGAVREPSSLIEFPMGLPSASEHLQDFGSREYQRTPSSLQRSPAPQNEPVIRVRPL